MTGFKLKAINSILDRVLVYTSNLANYYTLNGLIQPQFSILKSYKLEVQHELRWATVKVLAWPCLFWRP